MKLFVAILAILPVVMGVRPVSKQTFDFDNGSLRKAVSPLKADFDAWALKHSKTYRSPETLFANPANAWSHDFETEYARRLSIFTANHHTIHHLTGLGANTTWTFGFDGPFMDLELEEFKNILGFKSSPKETESSPKKSDRLNFAVPFALADTEPVASIDWREKGAVTLVKDQAQCGSCWAFSTTGGVEGANFLATGNLVSLSEQELVSCDKTDDGCGGGLMDQGFEWIIKNGGIDTEKDYEYTSGGGVTGTCNSPKVSDKAVSITSFTNVPNDEVSLRKAVSTQPISVAVDAQLWQFYQGGIFNGLFGYCGTTLDHGVLLVGHNVTGGSASSSDSTGYYIVKNSWGETWGENGFIRLPINKGAEGMCGITQSASFPSKTK